MAEQEENSLPPQPTITTTESDDPRSIFAGLKKKSKKPKATVEATEDIPQEPDQSAPNTTCQLDPQNPPLIKDSAIGDEYDEDFYQINEDRDYSYRFLLSRISKIIRTKNPELVGEKKKINMVLPQVNREGSKKSSFSNIFEVCQRLNRTVEHFIQFLLSELGTTGSLDSQNALIIRGRFQQKQIEAVLKRYVQDYVQCRTCKSAETNLTKENRLYFLRCNLCGSSRTVSAIKSGFKAQTEKRSAQRNKLV